jgi:hypothetical protein
MIAVSESIFTQCQCMGCDSEKHLPKTAQCKSQTDAPGKKFCGPCEAVQASVKSGVGVSGFGESPLGE